jgi:hypothetical protein
MDTIVQTIPQSGYWAGYYSELDGDGTLICQRMKIDFANGVLVGEGDEFIPGESFFIVGNYNLKENWLQCTKGFKDGRIVTYFGRLRHEEIYGTWWCRGQRGGSFRLWPAN